MPRNLFTSDEVAAGSRRRAWDAALTSFAIDATLMDGDAFDETCFFALMDSYVSPRGLKFSILESGPQLFSPTPGRTGGVFWLSMVIEGDAAMEIDGEMVDLAPGDIIYGKRGAAGSLEIRTPFRMLNMTIPTEVVARSVLVPMPDKVLRLRQDTGINVVLGGMLSAIGSSLERLRDERLFAIEDTLIRLLASCLFDDTGEVQLGGMASARAALLRRVWRSIEDRLCEPKLSIADIAEEHHLSVRYLQLLFEDHGTTFSAYVRRRRLDACRTDMADPINANVSITSICLHWGFAESASFSRAFREEYGTSPRQFRQQFSMLAPRKERRPLVGLTFV